VAHIGQELRLHQVGVVGAVPGVLQLGHHGLLLGLADRQLVQELVEDGAKTPEQGEAGLQHDRIVAAALRDPLHGGGQFEHRGDNPVGLDPRHDHGGGGAGEQEGAGQGQELGRDIGQAGATAHGHHLAKLLALADHGGAQDQHGAGGLVAMPVEAGHPVTGGIDILGGQEDRRHPQGADGGAHR